MVRPMPQGPAVDAACATANLIPFATEVDVQPRNPVVAADSPYRVLLTRLSSRSTPLFG